MRNKMLFSVAAATLAGVALLGTTSAFAQDTQTEGTTLVQRIAQKFNLNQADVQAVFDEHREENHAERQTRFEERLNQLVTEGKITEEQKTKILEKFNEQKAEKEANREEFKNMTPEERKAAHEAKHAELKTWAEQNGINFETVFGSFGHGRGMGKPMMN